MLVKKILFGFYKFLIKNFVTKVVANGSIDKKLLNKNSIKSTLIYNGINLEKYSCCRKNIKKNNFLYFGRLDTNKGIEYLIDFFINYKKKFPKFRLLF